MPKPSGNLLMQLGPEVEPFERTGYDRKIEEGEDILFNCYNATDDDRPTDVLEVDPTEIDSNPQHNKYIWIICKNGLYIILEATKNDKAKRGCVCHSNITEGKKALQGGEMWFGNDRRIYINYKSGRYGAITVIHQQAVLSYFRTVGYKEVIDITQST